MSSSEIRPRIDFTKSHAQEANEEEKNLRSDFARVASTEEGRGVLRAVWLACWMPYSAIGVDTNGDYSPNKLLYNTGKQDAWRQIRNFIPFDDLMKIENIRPKETAPKNVSEI